MQRTKFLCEILFFSVQQPRTGGP